MRQLKDWILKDKTRLFIFSGGVTAFLLIILDLIFMKRGSLLFMLVEAHGFFLDIVFFGIILTVYDLLTRRKRQITQYQEKLDDFRGWEEKSAMFRNVGNIRRLNRLGLSAINLNRSYLKEADLEETNLSGANVGQANFDKANLSGANLRNAKIWKTSFRESDLSRANLENVRTNVTNIDEFVEFFHHHLKPNESKPTVYEDSIITGVNFHRANLQYSKMKKAELISADLSYSTLVLADLEGADLRGADLTGAILLKNQNDLNESPLKANLANTRLEHARASLSQWDDFVFCGAPDEEMAKMQWDEMNEAQIASHMQASLKQGKRVKRLQESEK